MGLILPRRGFVFPRIPPPTPQAVLYSAVTQLVWGYVLAQNTPNSTPKHPFSWPELESGQNYRLGNLHPNWAIFLNSGQDWTKLF